MRQLFLNSIYIIIALLSYQVIAQNNPMGYRIDGDDVVFVFNKKDYKLATSDSQGYRVPFKDLDINTVVVSGQFNDWSKDKWRMTKINDNTYELRKKLTDFTDEFSWEFKFVINNEFWAEPSSKHSNIEDAKNNDGRPLHVYNLKMITGAYPDPNGNVRFRLKGYNDAKKVVVAGSFNKWNEDLFRMYKIENGWELILQLRPGDYQYRYIVDGHWMEDPTNLDKVPNEFDEYNSHISVEKYVKFKLYGYENAKKVILSGSFNDWNENECKMKKTKDGYWVYSILLCGGKHHYKFIVDGDWIVDPVNTVQEYDNSGNINSVCMVK